MQVWMQKVCKPRSLDATFLWACLFFRDFFHIFQYIEVSLQGSGFSETIFLENLSMAASKLNYSSQKFKIKW